MICSDESPSDRREEAKSPATSGVFYCLLWNPSTEGRAISGHVVMVRSEPKGMTYTVILIKGEKTRPTWTIEADTTEEACAQARRLFPIDDIALVANED